MTQQAPTQSEIRQPAGLVQRVKDILLRPRQTWTQIEAEPASAASLYFPYVALLAAIGPIAHLIGGQIFGYGALGFRFKPALGSALSSALVSYVLTLVGVFVLALIINALAPRFGGQKSQVQALKVAAYSGTAAWIAAIFGLVPALAVLSLAGLYSLYLLYLGLPRLMKAPEDRALGYTVVVIVAAAILFVVIGFASSNLISTSGRAPAGMPGMPGMFGQAEGGGTIDLPDGGQIDLGAAADAAGALGGIAGSLTGQSDSRPPIASAQLKELLPASLGALPRTSSESTQIALGSMASAVYEQGDVRIELTLTDLGAAGALARAMAPQMERERDGAYERVGRVDGRFTTEKYNGSNRSGSFGVLMGDRVMVQAEGRGVEINHLKGAVASIDARRIERLLS